MAENRINITVTASGAEQASKVLQSIATAGGQIGSVVPAATKRAEDALGTFQAVATRASGALAQAGINVGGLGTAIGALTSPLALAGAAFGALGLAVKTTTDFMVKNYDQMRGLMAVSGQTAEETDQLADTFDLLGLNAAALTAALFKMSAEIDSGGKGLRELGVDIRDSTGALKAEGAIFLEVRDRISQMGSAAERNAAAMKFFGRSAREMAEVFAMSTAEFNQWLETAGKMGPSAEESMRVTKEYTRALALLTKEFQGLVETVGQNVLPILTEFLINLRALGKTEPPPSWVTWLKDFVAANIAANLGLTEMSDKIRGVKQAQEELARGGAAGMFGGREAAPGAPSLLKAEVEQQRATLKELEADRLRSIALVQANMQAALKLQQADESEAAQQSIRLARETFAAKAAAIDGEIALIRRTSTAAIRDGTEAGDKIRTLLGQRKDAHGQMAVALVGFEATITKAGIEGQQAIAAASIETLKARLASSAALLGIKQQSAQDIVGVQGSDEAAFRARLDAETQAKIDAAEAQTKTSADYAAAVEAIMAAHYAKLSGFQREALARDIAAMPEALGEFSRNVELIGEATEADITPMEKAWEALRLEMVEVERTSAALGARFDATSALIKIQEERVKLLTAEFGPLSKEVQAAVAELDRLRTLPFADALEKINLQARLLGPSFDPLAPTIAEVTKEILRLGAAGQDVTALQEKLAGLKQVQELKGIFADVFSSIGSAISTSIQGVILGTQTLGQAFNNLWKSIVLSFVNSGVQRVLKGLQDWALDFFFGKSSGGGGGGGGLIAGFGGLLLSGGGGARPGGPGGSGVPFFDPTGQELPGVGGFNMALTSTVDTLGTFNTGLQVANTGINGFGQSMLGVSSIGAGLWGAVGGAGGALGPAFTGVGAIDVAIAGGSFLDVAGAANAAIGPISALTVGLAGVGAAVAVFGTIMDFVNGNTNAAIGGVAGGITGAVAGGLIGTFLLPGIGTVLGALAGGALGDWLGSMIGGLFGGPSNYELKRIKAADEASAFVGGTGQAYKAALDSGSVDKILAALQSLGTGVNPLRTELVLTSTLAEQLGLTGEREGDNVIVQWAQVTEAQLGELIALFKASPEMAADVIRGGGDIAYLTPDKVKPYVEALEQGAEALLTAFSALGAVTDKINEVAKDLTEAAKEALPPGLAQEFADGIVNPIRDRMLAVLNSGLPAAEMQKQLDAINRELQGKVEAWNMFAEAIKQSTVVDALIPADLHEKFRAAMDPAYDAMLHAMRTGTAEQAKLQAQHFATQTQAWAAFSDVAQAKMNVAALLEPIGDLGERFDAAMQPVYDKILASLVAGNGKIALAQTQTFARLTQAWAALGKATEQRLDVEALLPDDLADRFHAQMQPQFDRILAELAAGHAEVAAALVDRVTRALAVWTALGQATTQAIDVEALLPDDLGAQFHARMAPQWTGILAELAAGHIELAARMVDTFNKQVAAWASIGQTVTRITGELAGLTGNLEGTAASWIAVQRQMDGAVTRAQTAFDKALASGDVEQIARTAATLHDATLARLQAEMAMVKQIEDAIAATLQSASGLVELVTTVAQLEIAMSGSIGTVQALLGALEGMATSGATVTQRMWAVNAAIQTIIAVLPGLIEKTASFATAAEWLAKGMQTAEQLRSGPAGAGAITGAVITGAAPFLAAQQAEIDAAKGAARLALLQQQAATLQSLAAAAVAGVKQWAQAAIAGARAAADEVIKGARAEADRRIDVARTEAARRQALIDAAREKALAAIDAEIEAAETAARLGQEARRAQIEALQELIAKSKEWEAAVESMGKFIQSLKVGPLGPGNPADKLAQAQDAFSKALAAYNANPTAGGLTDLQALAQTLLGLAEPIFSKPSPQFQALSANILKQLEAAQALAAAQITDSAVLQAQLDMLIAMDKAATLASAALLDGLRVQREAITKDFEQQTKDLSDALEKYIGEIEEALKKYIGEVETALEKQIKAIEKAAKDEIDAINIGLIGVLKKNAEEQAGLIAEETKKIDTLIKALTSTEHEGVRLADIAVYAAKQQDVAIEILRGIKAGIEEAVGHPLARGSERVTEGLYHLHDDEAVLPKALAERFRAAGGFDRMIRSAADGAGITDPYGDLQYDPTGRYKPSLGNLAPKFVFTGPQAEALNQLQGIIEMLEGRLQADITGNTYKRFGKIYKRRTEAELEALKARVGEQVAELHRQQQALIDSIPPPPGPPPKVKPPPGTPPPYIPPGPAWLTRGGGDVNPNMANLAGGGMVGGPTTIIVKLDGKTIGEATLPTIHGDARGGKLRTIFLETRPK